MLVRIEFYKIGMVKFISHLDTIRLFSRAMKRAQIPILWSEGYNPHMKMSIAVPLSLGVESESETMDFEIEEDFPWETIPERLNAALPEGLKVTQVAVDFDKESVFSRVRSSDYEMFFPYELSPPYEELEKYVEEFKEKKEVLVERKRKKGKKKIVVTEDIRGKVISLDMERRETGIVLMARLSAGADNNLRPDRLLQGIFSHSDLDLDLDLVQIRRKRSFDKDGQEIRL
ncbi:TIGR03936 family radical SAM-associated protein [Peptoniphilus sp. KCTC 25270]|uniref:TIGR03936 family radical SAM-associated protein n=1 Tax=Peptoniphilus sp. KCTC 25270 TaxID=2897414 RepID=UPI001E312EC8|nr:TIGR03936 family radical SAM-associated protein [Peptoniphilus sp. KCTC 25270]MCD1146915.1 TIGR03936 family radical SAM-associated protein [Peptoniphilus sp. KCTC 25270]